MPERRNTERIGTWKVLHTYSQDHKVIVMGDAAYPKTVWINPSAEKYWSYSPSISLVSRTIGNRMLPLTLSRLDCAIHDLTH